MVRSSVAAFYAMPEGLFYSFAGPVRRDRFHMFRLLLPIRSEVEKVVHWMPEILFDAGPPQVVRCNALQACSLAAGSDHVPDNVLREAPATHFSTPGDRSKDFALTNPSGSCPLIESGFHPVRNGHRANVATFANKINDSPVPLAHLDIVQLQTDQFRSAEATTEQHGQHRIITLGAHRITEDWTR
jgi:hypothetical protein